VTLEKWTVRKFSILGLTLIMLGSPLKCFAENIKDQFLSVLQKEISTNYGDAEIQLSSNIQWVKGGNPAMPARITLLGDDGRGNLHFSVTDDLTFRVSEGWISFSAWVPARIALKRIRPGELLQPDHFVVQNVNVALGQPREYRGLILSQTTELQGLEAIQTILEGQFLLSSAVQRIPDVRRGDSVQVKLISGDLILTTQGHAEEAAYLNRPVRVMTGKNKRELMGYLQSGGVVEVKL
jgi:flagella basal body P-ring formation protein FlgA